jgi:hypothetical protein
MKKPMTGFWKKGLIPFKWVLLQGISADQLPFNGIDIAFSRALFFCFFPSDGKPQGALIRNESRTLFLVMLFNSQVLPNLNLRANPTTQITYTKPTVYEAKKYSHHRSKLRFGNGNGA